MKKLVIFGTGEISELAHYYYTYDSNYEVVGFAVDAEFKDREHHCGLPVVSSEEMMERFPPETHNAFVAISYAKMNSVRSEKVKDLESYGYALATYVSSKATVLTEHPIGKNCFILEDNTIQPFVKIGNNVTMWSGNHIGHHSEIRNGCFITSHVVISGGCKIGERSFIGVNSTLRDHIKIGVANMIGAGCLILSDTDDHAVYMNSMSEKSRVPSTRLRNI